MGNRAVHRRGWKQNRPHTPTTNNMIVESWANRDDRDEQWRKLRKTRAHVGRSTTSIQDDVRLANGYMVEGEMQYLVHYPRN